MTDGTRAGHGSTVAQLKADIDAGRTGDKAQNPDPGLSALGTDDEAGGRPNSPEIVDLARREEQDRSFDRTRDPGRAVGTWAIPVTVVLVVIAVAIFYVVRH